MKEIENIHKNEIGGGNTPRWWLTESNGIESLLFLLNVSGSTANPIRAGLHAFNALTSQYFTTV